MFSYIYVNALIQAHLALETSTGERLKDAFSVQRAWARYMREMNASVNGHESDAAVFYRNHLYWTLSPFVEV